MRKIQLDTPEETYVQAVTELHEARTAYDHRKGNKAFARMIEAAKQLRANRSDGGEQLFASLLTNDKSHVVKAAAFNLIPLNPKLARAALEELARGPSGEVRLDAELTLKEWDAGRLNADWFME